MAGVKERVEYRMGAFWYLIRKHAESIKFALKVLGAVIFYGLVYYGLYHVFELWHIWGALAGAPVLMALCYYLLRPTPNLIIEVKLRPLTIGVWRVGPDRLAKMRYKGDYTLRFRSKKGINVIICEEVNWDTNTIKFAWTHQLSSLEFLAYSTVFEYARELLEEWADELSVLNLGMSAAVKALKTELIRATTKALRKYARLPKKPEEEEAAMPAPAPTEGEAEAEEVSEAEQPA